MPGPLSHARTILPLADALRRACDLLDLEALGYKIPDDAPAYEAVREETKKLCEGQ